MAWTQDITATEQFTSSSAIFWTRLVPATMQWSAPISISQSYRNDEEPDVVTDEDGTLHVVWTGQMDGDVRQVFYCQRFRQGAWSIARPVSICGGDCSQPSASADGAQGVAVVAWTEDVGASARVLFANQYSDGNWNAAVDVSNLAGFSRSASSFVAPDGRIFVFWTNAQSGRETIYYSHRARYGNTWSVPITVTTAAADTNITSVRCELDRDWNVQLVWNTEEMGQEAAVWHSMGQPIVKPNTPTPTRTATITRTPTVTATPTATATSTSTATPRSPVWMPMLLRGRQ